MKPNQAHPFIQEPAGPQPPERCPHLSTPHAHCRASFNGLPITGDRRRHLCETEDYDLCGIFLARMLRQSRSLCYTPAVDVSSR